MGNHVTHIGIAVLLAAAAVACSGRTNKITAERDQTGNKRGTFSNVKVDGCVQAAPGNNQYTLQKVTVPGPAEQPVGNNAGEGPLITEGAWVRVTGGTQNLKDYLGKRVEIVGVVQDTGENTLGTSGRAGSDHDKYARSTHDAGTSPDRNMKPTTAAPAGADANGTAPLIAINTISKLADKCEGQ
jgi:hypothetical protein